MMPPRSRGAVLAFVALCSGACAAGDRSGPEVAGRAAPLREVWRWSAPPPAYVGMPEADDDAVAVTYGQTWLVLLDGAGKPRWTATRDDLRDVKPMLTPDLVVVATETGLAAFDRARGRPLWEADLGERANTPVAAGGVAVTNTWEGSLAAVDLSQGRVAWRQRLPGGALGPPATDGQVVVTTWETEDGESAGASAVDGATGARRWQAALVPGGVSAPAITRVAGSSPPEAAVAVVVAGDVAAHGLALDTGVERWHADLEGAGSPEVPPVALADGAVLVAHRLGGLVLLDGRVGSVRWAASSDGAAVRGGPVGPGPDGRYALPLDDGRLLLAGPEHPTEEVRPPGRVSGVVPGPRRLLLVATRETADNNLSASSGW